MTAKMTDSQMTGEKPKKATRARKTISEAASSPSVSPAIKDYKIFQEVVDFFSGLFEKIEQAKTETLGLQKEIMETKEKWQKEQAEHEVEIARASENQALTRKREEEEYEYQKKFERKKTEDEFAEKKGLWEKQLKEEKDKIDAERKELADLRNRVGSFEAELQKAVKEAQSVTTRDLEARYAGERKLREQEVKSEKDILALKIDSLTKENSRQTAEIETLKKAFDEATRQLKDVAVKVIEGRTPKIIDSSEV